MQFINQLPEIEQRNFLQIFRGVLGCLLTEIFGGDICPDIHFDEENLVKEFFEISKDLASFDYRKDVENKKAFSSLYNNFRPDRLTCKKSQKSL